MGATAKVRKWGSSLGIVLPKKIVEEKKLKENDEVTIEVIKEADLSEVYGSLNFKKTTQELKNEARKGWEKN